MKRITIAINSIMSIALITMIIVLLVCTKNLENTKPEIIWDEEKNINSAIDFLINESVQTEFGMYKPKTLNYTPKIVPTEIEPGLANVDWQDIRFLDSETIERLEQFGFAIVKSGCKSIFDIYDNTGCPGYPMFITTDLCLHSYHTLYDISLRVFEGEYFFRDFEKMLFALRKDQLTAIEGVTNEIIREAFKKNIAYLSIMLYLLNSTNTLPPLIEELATQELAFIEIGQVGISPIFGYLEDYSQYKVRGHYTRNEILSNYFQAMMYAGRMSFLLQSPEGDLGMGIDHTRRALLLISSFNSTFDSTSVWDYWERINQPITFFVGTSDDLTPTDYYNIWRQHESLSGEALADDAIIEGIIEDIKLLPKPKINSMIVNDTQDHSEVTQGLRLFGQKFIPDSYMFQELVHKKVDERFLPSGLDVFSVLGCKRAAYHQKEEEEIYPDYSNQILQLQQQFGELDEKDWTQNLYWLWLYSLFPLAWPLTAGYPEFMLNDSWSDKALMTALGSWAELRHDTLLYGKQSYSSLTSAPSMKNGYVEPYPEVYSRLSSLVDLMLEGLNSKGLEHWEINNKLTRLRHVYDRLTEISIKELENQPLNHTDLVFIHRAGDNLRYIASFKGENFTQWVNDADDQMAIIADVHTDPNFQQVLEVGVGNPNIIYVVVQDHEGNLRLTRGGTFSYYEFPHPMTNRLTDEEWQELLETNPPAIPDWLSSLIIELPRDNNHLASMIAIDYSNFRCFDNYFSISRRYFRYE